MARKWQFLERTLMTRSEVLRRLMAGEFDDICK
jgi:hypothetical protein